MKTKLKLNREVVNRLSNPTKVAGGMDLVKDTKTYCMDTFYSHCNCQADTQQLSCLQPGDPGMTNGCMVSHHCTYPCETQGYAPCKY